METPSRFSFDLDGATRVFPIATTIKGDNYCRLEVDGTIINDRTKYDIVNNSIVFLDVADVPSGSQLDVLVVQSEEAIGQLSITTNIDIVAQNIADVNTTADDIANVNTVAGNISDVNRVATSADNLDRVHTSIDNLDRVDTSIDKLDRVYTSIDNLDRVHTSIGNIDRVDQSIDNIDRVHTSIGNIDTVDASITNVDTVAGSIANVNTTAGSIANVNTTATNIASVNTVAADLNEPVSEIETVAGSIANVNTVGDDIANVNTTAGSIAGVNTTAGSIANVNTVATNIANVNTVAGIDANVTTVAGNDTNVTTVAGISGNVTTVANNDSNVTTVADNITTVNTVAGSITGIDNIATNLTEILDADNQATIATTKASEASASAVSAAQSAASAATVLDNFDDRYLGAKSADPSVDNDGDPLVVGALYFNSTDGVMKTYTSSGWLAASSASVATMAKFKFTATAGQTVFTGTDDGGDTLSMTVGSEIVTLNGIVLEAGTDYTPASGSVTLATGATADDEVNVYAFGNFQVADTVSKSLGGTFTGAVAFDGGLTVANAGLTTVNIEGSNPTILFKDTDATNDDLRIRNSGGDFILENGVDNSPTTDRLRITSDGNIIFYNGSSAAKFYWDASAESLGIGTSSPSAKLHLNNGFLQVDQGGTHAVRLGSTDQIVGGTDNEGVIQTNTNKGLRVFAGASERMRIDSAGRVTMPYQPMLYLDGNGDTTTATGARTEFTAKVQKGGITWNSSTGRVTVPVTGYYKIDLKFYHYSTTCRTTIHVNGSQVSLAHSEGATSDQTRAQFYVGYLAAGDYIEFRNNQTVYMGAAHSTACVQLIG